MMHPEKYVAIYIASNLLHCMYIFIIYVVYIKIPAYTALHVYIYNNYNILKRPTYSYAG